MRYDPPVPHATFRVTSETVTLAGIEIPAHQQVLVCIGGANRDPGVGENPQVFDLTRLPTRHLAFGHGIHFCLGAPLARLEARIAFTALLQRFRNFVSPSPATHSTGPTATDSCCVASPSCPSRSAQPASPP